MIVVAYLLLLTAMLNSAKAPISCALVSDASIADRKKLTRAGVK